MEDSPDPVERKLLGALSDTYVRSSNLVGDDEHAWERLARLAQPWVMRYPLVDGRGNFGSDDDDPPASAKYTEVRLTPLAHELEHFPNGLVNGSLPHNLREVAAAAEDPSFALVPDFPTGGVLVAHSPSSYTLRARAEIYEHRLRRHRIEITELPYGVMKGGDRGVIVQIIDALRDLDLPIDDVQDHSDGTGTHLMVDVARNALPDTVLAVLLQHTDLEVTRPIDSPPAREQLDRWLAEHSLWELKRVAEEYGDERRTSC